MINELNKNNLSDERFRAIFDSSPDGIVIIETTNGAEGKWPIEDCNTLFVEMNGYDDKEELIGRDIIDLTIEDYGVPIAEDELKNDLVFEMCYRGRFSAQGGRIGTGIGAGDARAMARRYGGNVTLESRPAHKDYKDALSVPHLKVATLMLPIYSNNFNKLNEHL